MVEPTDMNQISNNKKQRQRTSSSPSFGQEAPDIFGDGVQRKNMRWLIPMKKRKMSMKWRIPLSKKKEDFNEMADFILKETKKTIRCRISLLMKKNLRNMVFL